MNRQFGTVRGAVRLALSYLELGLGIASVKKPAPQDVRRLVFVCHGNICRSAFADVLARQAGMNTASFGLSTTSGNLAHGPIMERAEQLGLDMSGHRTTAVNDYVPQEGDYLLAMEVRHLRKLAANEALAHLPRGLLGSYAPFPLPHLHDPYKIAPEYLPVCLDRIARAVPRLSVSFPGAKASG